jgi:hypothetical protein
MISKHFFEHRYDYRAEWMRFTATLGQGGGEDDRNLYRRVAKALAELTGSPGALLMLPGASGGFRIAEQWHWPTAPSGEATLSLRSAFMLQETRHIVDLDAERRGQAHEDLAIPDWLIADPRAWVVVPVLHFQRMIAIVVLHRPAVSRALDWEDLDVLRIAGQQAASYLAESQSQQALSEARRFDEFNRRFAFIMHDIKNLASQIGLLARNAERHADKPDFRADMIETLKNSAGRLSDLLVRLSPRERGPAAEAGRTLIEPVLNAIAAEMRAAPLAVRRLSGWPVGVGRCWRDPADRPASGRQCDRRFRRGHFGSGRCGRRTRARADRRDRSGQRHDARLHSRRTVQAVRVDEGIRLRPRGVRSAADRADGGRRDRRGERAGQGQQLYPVAAACRYARRLCRNDTRVMKVGRT